VRLKDLLRIGSFFSLLAFPSLIPKSADAADAPRAEQQAFEEQLKRSASASPPAPARSKASPSACAKAEAPSAAPAAKVAAYDFSDGTAEGQLGSVEMRRANRAAAEVLQRRMETERPNDFKLIREAAGADVVVVSGVYDRVQDVLRAVQVKHVVIPPHLLSRIDLLATQTLMINCPGDISDAAVKKVQSFVARGGYLVTTDWALKLIGRAFPNTIEHNGKTTPNDVVSVHVHDANEPLLRHVKVMREHPRWWLEGSSYPIRIKDEKGVRVLMSSSEMQKKYGDGAVVVAFHHQQGKVLHMTSHFYLQQGKLVAESEKKSGREFAKDAGMNDKDLEALRKKGVNLDEVKTGELNAAYSMQQVSANLLVEKQAANQELLNKQYRARMIQDDVRLAPGPKAAPAASAPRLRKDYRVQVLEKKDGQARVRDLFGNEGWIPAPAFAE
jgi:hypothetical protein